MDGMTRDGYLKIVSSIISEVSKEIKTSGMSSPASALARFEQLLRQKIPDYKSHYPTTFLKSPTEGEKDEIATGWH